jgi:hypothetical protein
MWGMWIAVALAGDVQATVDELASLRGLRLLDSVPDVPADAYLRAASGEVVTGLVEVPGQKARKAWGIGVVDASIDRYWAAVNDDRSKVQWTKLDHLSLLRGEYCGAERLVFQYLGVTMLTDRWWVVQQQQNVTLHEQSGGRMREMTWKSIEGGEELFDDRDREWADQGMRIPFTEGAWLLVVQQLAQEGPTCL